MEKVATGQKRNGGRPPSLDQVTPLGAQQVYRIAALLTLTYLTWDDGGREGDVAMECYYLHVISLTLLLSLTWNNREE